MATVSLATALSPHLWRGRASSETAGHVAGRSGGHQRTGFPALDAHLPGGGWPLGAVTEVLTEHRGVGELQLVLPAVASITQAGRWAVWITPPHIPYAPALEARGVVLARVLCIGSGEPSDRSGAGALDYLWAAEQALRQPECGAVLLWLESCPHEGKVLRRLQLAAEAGGGWGILFRPARIAERASPAAVRLGLRASVQGTEVRVLKCRGRAPRDAVMRL